MTPKSQIDVNENFHNFCKENSIDRAILISDKYTNANDSDAIILSKNVHESELISVIHTQLTEIFSAIGKLTKTEETIYNPNTNETDRH
jgi:hypothetical protein